ncbi:probable disease resistance protein At4g27220 [Henckelia pumila]|uniref:probable disease resistance protein At4g27220 n=1 Tax=Henckelia pumila TaxID=405737 RepID=UPI003C6E2743
MENREKGGFEYVKEIVKDIVTKLLLPPVKRHLDYFFCFHDNIRDLEGEVRCLERERRDMDQKIQEGRFRAESANPEVENWSNEAAQRLEEARRILRRGHELKPWNIILWYLVGKSAKVTAQGISRLRREGNSITITHPANPRSMGSISHEQTLVFESRRRAEDDIVEFLKDNHVGIIAICGVEGVGKTTMVQIIEDRVRREGLFDEVVPVVVGPQIDMLKIQKEMAEILGLRLREESLVGRAHKIRTRLLDERRKLVIFDDVWESFELKDIGVPFGGCKIILTSRSRDVCEEMDAHKVVQIEALDEEEAWRLFSAKSGGECVDNSELRPIAEAVAAECRGLPLALVTTGKALKNRSIHAWEDWLLQRRRANALGK